MNTYTDANATSSPPPDATLVHTGSGYKFLLDTTAARIGTQSINYTVTIIGTGTGNVRVCTGCSRVILRFDFFTPPGTRIDGSSTNPDVANATYTIFKGATRLLSENDSQTIQMRSASVAASCPESTQVCYDATNSIGFNLTLVFRFGWNLPASKELSVQVGNVALPLNLRPGDHPPTKPQPSTDNDGPDNEHTKIDLSSHREPSPDLLAAQ